MLAGSASILSPPLSWEGPALGKVLNHLLTSLRFSLELNIDKNRILLTESECCFFFAAAAAATTLLIGMLVQSHVVVVDN